MKLIAPILVMAGVTYFIRMIPFALITKKVKNRFFRSFLYYVPYGVLSAMTFPAILYATGDVRTGAAALIAALIPAFFGKSLITVALAASGGVLAAQLLLYFLG